MSHPTLLEVTVNIPSRIEGSEDEGVDLVIEVLVDAEAVGVAEVMVIRMGLAVRTTLPPTMVPSRVGSPTSDLKGIILIIIITIIISPRVVAVGHPLSVS